MAVESITDAQLVAHVVAGHVPAFTILMRRYNRRLFRVIRGVLPDDTEAEDACQEAWLRAYEHLAGLQRGGAFATWLCRIGLRCALERMPRHHTHASLDELDRLPIAPVLDGPELEVDHRRIAEVLELAIDRLLPAQRLVVLLRDVEQLTTGEVAEVLGVSEENVRVRLHRAHTRLREQLSDAWDGELVATFAFDGERCDRLVGAVVRRIHSVQRQSA
ncbi:MAG TPA: sigma-70 family RNA polymerase sigma factor [Nannocystaceae bacterium]|nr:sigma-70 family RNA polymerase sigma factor [Nannocystaceae bacterium]